MKRLVLRLTAAALLSISSMAAITIGTRAIGGANHSVSTLPLGGPKDLASYCDLGEICGLYARIRPDDVHAVGFGGAVELAGTCDARTCDMVPFGTSQARIRVEDEDTHTEIESG